MNKKAGTIIGLLILAAVVILGYIFTQGSGKPAAMTVKGSIGGEKIGFFDDADVQKILKDKYNITVEYTKVGSIDMVKNFASGQDFLFPSNQVALELFKTTHGADIKGSEVIFNSPIVFFSWDKVTDALSANQTVSKNGDVYTADTAKFLDLIASGKKWSDVGLKQLYGNVTILSTDPSKSNSGNMFAGLYANMANGGNVVNAQTVVPLLPKISEFFKSLGYLEPSSSNLFEQYLKTGMGAKPIIVGYENQLIEFAEEHPDIWNQVKIRTRILYPTPTVWSSHPLIALDDKGKALLTALKDKQIQEIAWKKHGFRSGLVDIQNDTKALGIQGLADNVESVVQMPSPQVMDQIINAVK